MQPTLDADQARAARRSKRVAGLRGALLALAGIALVGWLIRSVGPARVWQVFLQAAPWLPLLVLLELAVIAGDVLATRAILGPATPAIAPALWVRSSALSYAAMIFLPGGRAASEATRATLLARAIGAMRATRLGIVMQGTALIANTLTSLVALGVVVWRMGIADPLTVAVAVNAGVTALLGALFLGAARHRGLAEWLRARVPFLRGAGDDPAHAESATVRHALPYVLIARALQTVQFGVGLVAIGAVSSVALAWVAQGVQLVGAAAGDLVPNQVGVTEAASKLFARPLGLEHDAARAVSFALVIRWVQLALGLTCLLVGNLFVARATVATTAPDIDEPPLPSRDVAP
jgi:hypothetical protein